MPASPFENLFGKESTIMLSNRHWPVCPCAKGHNRYYGMDVPNLSTFLRLILTVTSLWNTRETDDIYEAAGLPSTNVPTRLWNK